MADRRSLTQGLSETPTPIVPDRERKFVYANGSDAGRQTGAAPAAAPVARAPVTTRIRDDYAKALKRISLERQLQGLQPSTLQEILEEAILAWLAANGELPGD